MLTEETTLETTTTSSLTIVHDVAWTGIGLYAGYRLGRRFVQWRKDRKMWKVVEYLADNVDKLPE
jgi:hypothetical protein